MRRRITCSPKFANLLNISSQLRKTLSVLSTTHRPLKPLSENRSPAALYRKNSIPSLVEKIRTFGKAGEFEGTSCCHCLSSPLTFLPRLGGIYQSRQAQEEKSMTTLKKKQLSSVFCSQRSNFINSFPHIQKLSHPIFLECGLIEKGRFV